ncbi:MAG TPA: GNAT family N-acetyltransferase [Ktedonobacteraceae bacterium]|nr:GNAT family N-acetyltransferase [Ktedonobacteraceae bacterium]
MSYRDRTLLRLHIEAVWGIQLPPIIHDDIEVLSEGVQPPWKLLVAEVANSRVHIWRADVTTNERKAVLKCANEALVLSATEPTAPGISREIALHLAAQSSLDIARAQQIARPLTSDDRSLIEAFQGDPEEYFLEIEKQPVIGVIIDGRLVSVAHSSRRTLESCELGIDTLPEARRRGYALVATVTWTSMIQQEGLIPLYSAFVDNKASLALAAAAGYRAFAYVATVEDL